MKMLICLYSYNILQIAYFTYVKLNYDHKAKI